MRYQEQFNSEEWQTLQMSILWVFHAIAEVDGLVDEAETSALMGVFKGELFYENPLMHEVIDSIEGGMTPLMEKFRLSTRPIPTGLMETGMLVEERLSAEEAAQFKLTLLFLGIAFARASADPGVGIAAPRMGMGEIAAIQTVAAILRLPLEELDI
ncbi:MAG: hypothetical protein JW750_10875 [Anaerolineaceae bacterium]|nr:hypothetical protein [Anaerolineaceae bacterium]